MDALGRILQLDVTLRNVCPGKRVALAVILTEVDPEDNEYTRGTKTMVIPAHAAPGCRDVTVRCIKFVLPEALDVSGNPDTLCGQRFFRARFIAEEPQLGAVSEGTLRRFMTDEDIFGESKDMWNYHMKSNPAIKTTLYDMSLSFARGILGDFADGKDRVFKLRYLQYEWIRLLMEQSRRELWFSSGIIFWMLNDCWPASAGWSLMDYYEKPKDALFSFKRCAAPVILSTDRSGNNINVYASNLRGRVKNATLTLTRVKNNKATRVLELTRDIAKESAHRIAGVNITLDEGEVLIAELRADGVYDRTFYKDGSLKLYPTDAVTVSHDRESMTVTLSASSYVHVAELDADAVFSDNCFTLLPGESRTVSYVPIGRVEDVTLTAYTV